MGRDRVALEGEQDDDRVQQPIEGEGGDAGDELRLVPLPPAPPFADGPGEVPSYQWDPEEDGDGLRDPPYRELESNGVESEPARKHLEVEVPEQGEGHDLEQ